MFFFSTQLIHNLKIILRIFCFPFSRLYTNSRAFLACLFIVACGSFCLSLPCATSSHDIYERWLNASFIISVFSWEMFPYAHSRGRIEVNNSRMKSSERYERARKENRKANTRRKAKGKKIFFDFSRRRLEKQKTRIFDLHESYF